MARADIGQRNATLILTKTANLFRETSKGAPAPAAPTLIGAFRIAIKSGNADKCTVSDLQAATRGSPGLALVTTNEIILKEQDQIIIAMTVVWGPLPPGMIGLILWR